MINVERVAGSVLADAVESGRLANMVALAANADGVMFRVLMGCLTPAVA